MSGTARLRSSHGDRASGALRRRATSHGMRPGAPCRELRSGCSPASWPRSTHWMHVWYRRRSSIMTVESAVALRGRCSRSKPAGGGHPAVCSRGPRRVNPTDLDVWCSQRDRQAPAEVAYQFQGQLQSLGLGPGVAVRRVTAGSGAGCGSCRPAVEHGDPRSTRAGNTGSRYCRAPSVVIDDSFAVGGE